MKFWQMSDGIPLYYQPHHLDGYDGQNGHGAAWLDPSPNSAIDTGNNSYGDGGYGVFPGTKVLPPGAIWNSLEPGRQGIHDRADGELSEKFHPDQHAVQNADMGSNGGSIHSGANEAGNGGNGYSYGGIIHASFILYQPINIAVAIGYGSSAHAEQTNDVHIDQSAVQIAGVGGNGGNGNVASGGNVDSSSSGADVIATGGNSAGNGGDGSFFGSLVNAPVVIYHPINIAIARGGGTAEATQSNTVEIDQSTVQIAGVGGNGGNGNAASGGNVTAAWRYLRIEQQRGGVLAAARPAMVATAPFMEAPSTHPSCCITQSTSR